MWLIAAVGVGYALWQQFTRRRAAEWVTEGMPSTTEWPIEDLHDEVGGGNHSAVVDDLLQKLGG